MTTSDSSAPRSPNTVARDKLLHELIDRCPHGEDDPYCPLSIFRTMASESRHAIIRAMTPGEKRRIAEYHARCDECKQIRKEARHLSTIARDDDVSRIA